MGICNVLLEKKIGDLFDLKEEYY